MLDPNNLSADEEEHPVIGTKRERDKDSDSYDQVELKRLKS